MTILPGMPLAKVKQYWWRAVDNFGDALAPLLLERFTAADLEWAPVEDATIVTIGSVLEHLPQAWSGYICGAGKLKEGSSVNVTHATVLALRGPLSAKGIKGNYVLGDPGLLADELVGPQNKRWNLGIVPHWRDKTLVNRFLQLVKPPSTIRIINPRQRPLKVVAEIGACQRIVTSSLHGMIVADAFGIPRRVELAPELQNTTEGGDFKFRDYSGSIKEKFQPGVMTLPSRWAVEDVKHAIYDAYKILEREMQETAPQP